MASILYLVTDGRNVENMTTLELAFSSKQTLLLS